MLNKIIRYSLSNKLVVLIAAMLILISGTYIASKMEVDVFPNLSAPTVVVLTEAHGMAPEEVERLVTFPIETAVNGATNIRRVRSSSAMGFSIVWVEFDWGMDVYNARQIVSEKLSTVSGNLPEGVAMPILAPQSSIMGEIMILALSADSTSAMDLRTIAEWNLRPQLLSVGGVAQVTIIGGDFKEYQILADPVKMQSHKVSFTELIESCKFSNENVPGGFLNEYGQEYIIRGMARSNNIEEIGNNFIKMQDGFPIKVNDVARVEIGAAPVIGSASYQAQDAVVITLTKQPNINTLELTEDIKARLIELEETLPEDVQIHSDIFDQAKFIKTSVNNVAKALFEGGIFVAIILLIFLMNFRTTIISLLAIPLSLLVAIILMKWMGISINTMTLGGMAIAIGSLVDDAIIDVENVYKRLRENIRLPKADRRNPIEVIYSASVEIRASILNATIIIMVAFIPLFFLSGMEGKMLQPLGIAYIVSLFASLIVAVSIIPVLSYFLLSNEKHLEKKQKGSFVERYISKIYSLSLEKALKSYKAIIGFTILLFLGSILLLSSFGRSFLPPFNEGSLTINTTTMPGINMEESTIIKKQAEQVLMSIPEIESVTSRTGRAELAEHSFGVNVSEIDAPYTLEERSRSDFLKEVRGKLNTIEGISVEVGQPISHRIDAMLSGSKANIAIKVFGTELNEMYAIATRIKTKIQEVEGIGDLSVEQQIEIPQLQIVPNREMLARYGISLNQFLEFIDYAFAGEKISDVFENERAYNLTLRFEDPYRDNIEAVKNALIDTYDGQKIPLYYVADIKSEMGPSTIGRENVMRKLVVSVNVADRDVRSVVNDIQDIVGDEIQLPENYRIEYGGQFESEAEASRILLITTFGAIIIIFMLLYMEFKNAWLSFIVLINLPLAIIGGVVAIWMHSQVISIPAIIGFITLFGIATRNGILLISRYQALNLQGEKLKHRIIHGSADRLNPILMTALTAALALIPLAIAGDKPGNEIQSPMAIVILGGLLSSTLLNIYIVPIIYYLFSKRKEGKENA